MAWGEWALINIPTYLPMLEEVGFGGQPGYYECKWNHNTSGQGIALLVRPAGESERRKQAGVKDDDYPHLTIDFDPGSGTLVWFHYSLAHKKQLGGARELVKVLLPVLRSSLGSMPTEVVSAILRDR